MKFLACYYAYSLLIEYYYATTTTFLVNVKNMFGKMNLFLKIFVLEMYL